MNGLYRAPPTPPARYLKRAPRLDERHWESLRRVKRVGPPQPAGANCEVDLIAAAEAVLADPTTAWEERGVWEMDGPAVLIDSVTAGSELGVEYPASSGVPEQAPVPIRPGRWAVRAVYASPIEETSVGVIHLLPWSSH
ncbi:Imm21 family immunity protein [Streptomyces sp. NPDC002132]|uniref:Imm21 family immunity protein n=1 Tax=unclassified Streptomyces TaxID=2593676 RepID=UPI003332541E